MPAAGSGLPPVLLLHGSGPGVSAAANWGTVIPHLAATRRVIAPDQLGFGGTATGEKRLWPGCLDQACGQCVLDAVGIGQVDVIGNSMGGAVALAMAATKPAAIRRIVLMGSMGVAMALPPGLDAVWGYRPGVQAMPEVIGLFAYDRSLITDDLVRMCYEASRNPAEFLDVVEPFLAAASQTKAAEA